MSETEKQIAKLQQEAAKFLESQKSQRGTDPESTYQRQGGQVIVGNGTPLSPDFVPSGGGSQSR